VISYTHEPHITEETLKIKFIERFRMNRLYQKHLRITMQALRAIEFINYNQKRRQWPRHQQRQWWNDFCKSPEARTGAVNRYIEEIQVSQKMMKASMKEKR